MFWAGLKAGLREEGQETSMGFLFWSGAWDWGRVPPGTHGLHVLNLPPAPKREYLGFLISMPRSEAQRQEGAGRPRRCQ